LGIIPVPFPGFQLVQLRKKTGNFCCTWRIPAVQRKKAFPFCEKAGPVLSISTIFKLIFCSMLIPVVITGVFSKIFSFCQAAMSFRQIEDGIGGFRTKSRNTLRKKSFILSS